MERWSNRQKWFVAGAGGFIFVYCLLVLGFVATSPDVRIRCLIDDELLLSDDELLLSEEELPLGIVIRGAPNLKVAEGCPEPRPGDKLIRLGERQIDTFLDFTLALRDLRHAPADLLIAGTDVSEEIGHLHWLVEDAHKGQRLVEVEFQRSDEATSQTSFVLLQTLPMGEVILSFVWFILQLGIFVVGALAVWHRPFDRPARLFFAMCVVTLGAFLGGFHWWVIAESVWLNIPFIVCAVLVPAVSLHFFLTYPCPTPPIARFPRLTMLGIYAVPVTAIVGMVAIMGYSAGLNSGTESIRTVAQAVQIQRLLGLLRQGIYVYLMFAAVCFVFMVVALAYGFIRTRNPIERSQMKWMFWASMIAVVPVGYTLYLAFSEYMGLSPRAEFSLGWLPRILMFLASLSFMLAYAVGIIRFKLMLVDQIINRGMVYYAASSGLTILCGTTIAFSSLLVNFWNKSLSAQQVLQQALFVTVILLLVIVLMMLLRDWFQQMIDRKFYREKYQLDKALQRVNRAVGHLVDRQSLSHRMLSSCRDVLDVERTALYLRDSDRDAFQLIAVEGAENIPLQFVTDKYVLETLKHDSMIQRITPGIRSGNAPVQEMLRSLDAELLYSLEMDGEIAGLVALGAKINGTPYTAEDLTFLSALGQITSVALHSAKVHQDLGRLNDELRLKVDTIAEQNRRIAMLNAELSSTQVAADLPEEPEFRREAITGNSPAIREVLGIVRKVATSESSVIIYGASGTGKELLAKILHDNSPRRTGPLVRVHCAALSASLLESELFGHVKGAFTGAHRDRIGRFEMASGGTLFLDEIGDISLETQIKLLRVLQSRSFEPVGGTRTVQVDVRLITATHQDLKKLIADGRFREDLYYRLNVISITLPSLSDRREDIIDLAMHFLSQTSKRIGKRITNIDEDAVKTLTQYSWPGNIRELENTIERAVVLSEGDKITLRDLPAELTGGRPLYPGHVIETKPEIIDVNNAVEFPKMAWRQRGEPQKFSDSSTERETLETALRECRGNKAQAARMLRMPRSTYYSKLKKYAIG